MIDLSHFTLPDGLVQIAFSGGRSSAYSRAEMRDFMDRQGDAFDSLIKVGALCQKNDGDCT